MSLKINPKKNKQIKFDVTLEGIDSKNINGSFKINIDNVEYGFPIIVESGNKIKTEIPILNEIIKRKINEDEIFESKLELNGNGFYFEPWKDNIEIESGIMIEAKIENINDTNDKPNIILNENRKLKKLKERNIKSKPKPKKIELPKEITTEQIYKYIGKLGTKNEDIQEIIYNQAVEQCKSSDPKKIITEIYKILKH